MMMIYFKLYPVPLISTLLAWLRMGKILFFFPVTNGIREMSSVSVYNKNCQHTCKLLVYYTYKTHVYKNIKIQSITKQEKKELYIGV
jgi:hypothetical protein